MKEITRLFDFIQYQLDNGAKKDMIVGKSSGQWREYATEEVVQIVNQLSAGLLKSGICGNSLTPDTQDKIAIVSKNRPEWIFLDLACQQIGAILCPIYPTTHINEVEYIFNNAEVKLVFVNDRADLEKINIVRNKIPSLQNIYSFEDLADTDHWSRLLQNIHQEDFDKVEKTKKTILASHCATIIYTSGTTGKPKGVMLSHKNIVSNILNAIKTFPFDENPTWRALSFLPLNHIFERLITYVYIRSYISIYFAESMDTIPENLKEVRPNMFTTVPRLLEKVYERIMQRGTELSGLQKKLFDWSVRIGNKYDIDKGGGNYWYNLQLAIANKLIFSKWREGLGGNIKFIVTGGAACQARLIKIFTAARIEIFEGYGPTENSPVISVNCHKKGGLRVGTVGLVVEGQEVKIEPDGEICVKGPSVMMGYYKDPELTKETIIDGWLHTGDIGEFEDGKYLKITDRKKELFKTSGGKYVAPQPIENKMKESPFVEQIMVLGSDRKYVSALIVPSSTNLRVWMLKKNIPFSTIETAVKDQRVIDFYQQLIDSFNTFFNHVEQIKKFVLLPDEWTIETGELTPTLKLKRKTIMLEYEDIIENIYQ